MDSHFFSVLTNLLINVKISVDLSKGEIYERDNY